MIVATILEQTDGAIDVDVLSRTTVSVDSGRVPQSFLDKEIAINMRT